MKQIETKNSIPFHCHSPQSSLPKEIIETIQYNPVHSFDSLDSIVTNLQNDQVKHISILNIESNSIVSVSIFDFS